MVPLLTRCLQRKRSILLNKCVFKTIFCLSNTSINHLPKCMSCHKAIVVITGRAHCFHDYIYIMLILLFWDLSTLCVVNHLNDHLYYAPCVACWVLLGFVLPAMCNRASSFTYVYDHQCKKSSKLVKRSAAIINTIVFNIINRDIKKSIFSERAIISSFLLISKKKSRNDIKNYKSISIQNAFTIIYD